MPYYQRNPRQFTPRAPVKTFRDLEVYQKTMEASVLIMKNLKAKLARLGFPFAEQFTNGAMAIPLFIAEAHSVRFADNHSGKILLERSMAGCNKMVVYLEQIRGMYGSRLADEGLVEDLIKRYSDVRTKIFHLEKSWEKFQREKQA
ncbi:MAG: hypothetical protein HY978_00860 [Candidatus Liptonbacteria bacterium]|nr:hypothetical protein [Candidatus Liptonbacteria bacterium]